MLTTRAVDRYPFRPTVAVAVPVVIVVLEAIQEHQERLTRRKVMLRKLQRQILIPTKAAAGQATRMTQMKTLVI